MYGTQPETHYVVTTCTYLLVLYVSFLNVLHKPPLTLPDYQNFLQNYSEPHSTTN